jgi:hypothetical protein
VTYQLIQRGRGDRKRSRLRRNSLGTALIVRVLYVCAALLLSMSQVLAERAALQISDAAPHPRTQEPSAQAAGVSAEVLSPHEVAETAARATPATRLVEQGRAERLHAALQLTAEATARTKLWSGVTGSALGGVAVATGVLVAVQDNSTWGRGAGRAALSSALLSLGASVIATSIYRWSSDSPAEKRLRRWDERARTDSLDALELTRFEAELAAEAEVSESLRLGTVATSLAGIAGSAALLTLSATGAIEGKGARSAGYIIGAIGAAVGAAQTLLTLLVASPAERGWHEYTEHVASGTIDLGFNDYERAR